MDVASSNGSDSALDEGEGALVAPELSDDNDEEIHIGDLGRDSVEVRLGGEDIGTGRYGMLVPDSSNDSDEEIPVGSLGLILSDAQTDSGSEIEVGDLGLDSVDSRMSADEGDSNDRDRARPMDRMPLPQVNPATGQYTAESFAGVPEEWLD
jgi:hypothetical protein